MSEESQTLFKAFVFVRFQEKALSDFIKWCRKEPKVIQFSTLTGEYDGVLEVEFKILDDLYQFCAELDKFDGIQMMNSHLVMQEWNS